MKAYILVQQLRIGQATQRFLKFNFKIHSDVISFEKIKKNFPDIKKYDLAIANIYQHKNHIIRSIGLQYVGFFEGKNVPVILFYYDNYLKPEFTVKELPENCFYLPLQIKEFFQYIKNSNKLVNSVKKLKRMFYSSGLTSKH